ncbi:hypothetical protein HFU84_03885 [Acidithiobacillus sp. CV18-2]|nr:hypothetical protein [Acidithiobacillus sp. CV18-3]MBU2755904.1 hypothetical protein [Acidithiobacillus sp. BN09-2]MBU2776655.1 hypothetical protein [Acidithiobacillus sp. CV18-2]MBU2799213.1 hypothetical protein [Acidithiobacillus sp. VAN18-4]
MLKQNTIIFVMIMNLASFVFGYAARDFHFFQPSNVIGLQIAQKAASQATEGKVRVVRVEKQQGPFEPIVMRYPNGSLHDGLIILYHGQIAGFAVGPVYGSKGQDLIMSLAQASRGEQAPGGRLPLHKTATTVHAAPAHLQTVSEHLAQPDASAQPRQAQPRQAQPDAKVVDFYLQHTKGFVWGKNPATPLYAFVDPNCIFCHKWYESEKAAVDAGRISFHIVMVATLKPSSVPRAIEIMEAKSPLQAWLEDERDFHEMTETGGLPVTIHHIPDIQKHPTPGASSLPGQKSIAINTTVLYRLDDRHPVTPTFADPYGTIWLGIHHDKEMQDVFFAQEKTH